MAQREALTIRFPEEILAQAKATKEEQESLNEFVVQAVEREARRRRGLAAHAVILRTREQIRARTGPHPDSGPLIREIRDGTDSLG